MASTPSKKMFLFQLMTTVQLQDEKLYDTQMVMHTGTHTSDVSLVIIFLKHLSHEARKNRLKH